MDRDTASLIVELVQKCEAAFVEVDEHLDTIGAMREQRAILLQQNGEYQKRIARQDARIAALCEENRALRQQVAEWLKAAA